MNTQEILTEIEENGGFDNFNKWTREDIKDWVKANFNCSNYVAKNVAFHLKN